MNKKHGRPADDFRVTMVAWELKSEATHRAAGFNPVARETIVRRFRQFITLLDREGMLANPNAARAEQITDESELRNQDLTDEGFEFVRQYHGKWLSRAFKDKGELKEQAFLDKWLQQFRSPKTSRSNQ